MTNVIPVEMSLWMGHEAAECLGYQKHLPDDYGDGTSDRWLLLYRKLWAFTNDAERPVPAGGDGSPDAWGNPTVGTPEEQRDYRWSSDDRGEVWWKKLDPAEQVALIAACDDDFGASR